MDSDGSFPKELARTRSLSYSLMNMDAFTTLCEIAHHRGVDLWNYEQEDGRGMRKAMAFIAPYVRDPSKWTHPQMEQFEPMDRLSLQCAAHRFGVTDFSQINKGRRNNRPIMAAQQPFGPLELYPGFEMASARMD